MAPLLDHPRAHAAHPSAFLVRTRRDRLIAAMATVVGDEGYTATTVGRVVATAAVSRNAFYEHFTNKEECFLATYDTAVGLMLGGVREATATAPTREEALRAGLTAFLRFAAAEPAFATTCFVEVLAAGPRALARRDEAMRAFAALLERCGRSGGGEQPIPRLMTEAIVGGVYAVVYARILEGRTKNLPDLVPDVMDVWLTPFIDASGAHATRARAACASPPSVDGPSSSRLPASLLGART